MMNWDFFHSSSDDAYHDDVKLKEHIASGAPNVWNVRRGNEFSETFDNFEAANQCFEASPPQTWASLVLYTRIGTSVQFRVRGAKT